MMKKSSYVLITPARNEAQFIELTIRSVVAQTILPLKWVIVSDGSTDGTDDIVRKYMADNSWIELVRMPERKERHFAGKVLAFNAGYARVKELQFEAVGSVDADASFDEQYFEFLLQRLAEDSTLGLVGTAFKETYGKGYDYRFVSIEHVTGICQLFRRKCFEGIGGYVPAKGGAIDRIANIAARMNGWKTRTFTEKTYFHHRRMSTAEQGILKARFKDGGKDYAVGSHPVWELCRTMYQTTKPPLVIGGAVLFLGYAWSYVLNRQRPVSNEMVRFHRQEQMLRLKGFVAHKFKAEKRHTERRDMNFAQSALTFMQGFFKSYGPSSVKKRLWDKEFSGGKWDFIDNTLGDCVYPYLERYANNGAILDLGCGPGNTANELGFESYRTYVGVDISEEALRKAQVRSEKNGRAGKNQFAQGDFLSFEPTQKFNVILFRESMYHVPLSKVKPILDRFSEYLTTDGVFIVRMNTTGGKLGRPKAISDVMESEFDVHEKQQFGDAGPTVLVFRPRTSQSKTINAAMAGSGAQS